MKVGDKVYIVNYHKNIKHVFIYQGTIIKPYSNWEHHWEVRFDKVVFDFMNHTFLGKIEVFDEKTHLFKTFKEAFKAIKETSDYYINEYKVIKEIFK